MNGLALLWAFYIQHCSH